MFTYKYMCCIDKTLSIHILSFTLAHNLSVTILFVHHHFVQNWRSLNVFIITNYTHIIIIFLLQSISTMDLIIGQLRKDLWCDIKLTSKNERARLSSVFVCCELRSRDSRDYFSVSTKWTIEFAEILLWYTTVQAESNPYTKI